MGRSRTHKYIGLKSTGHDTRLCCHKIKNLTDRKDENVVFEHDMKRLEGRTRVYGYTDRRQQKKTTNKNKKFSYSILKKIHNTSITINNKDG